MVDQGQTAKALERSIDVLGVGWKYPFRFSTATGGVAQSDQQDTSRGLNHVKERIAQIMATVVGQRRMRVTFGSRIHDRLFRPNDLTLASDLRADVAEAIARNERQIRLINVEVIQARSSRARVDIVVDFVVLRTQQPGNLVFPFFLEPAEVTT